MTAAISFHWIVDIADPAVIDMVRQIEKLGEKQYDGYVKERLVRQTKPISDPIKKKNFLLFSRPPVRENTKSQRKVTSLRDDCSPFSRLYIASQVRMGIRMKFSNMKIKYTHQRYLKMEN